MPSPPLASLVGGEFIEAAERRVGARRQPPSPPSWGRVHRGFNKTTETLVLVPTLASLVGASSSRHEALVVLAKPHGTLASLVGASSSRLGGRQGGVLDLHPRLPRGGEFIEAY